MSDLLIDIASRPFQKKIYQTLRLPVKLPQPLERRAEAWRSDELKGRAVRLHSQNSEIKSLIADAGGDLRESGDCHALVYDGSALQSLDQLREAYDFFKVNLASLRRCGHIVLIGRKPDGGQIETFAVQQALIGLTKSLAKEVGARGATCQLLLSEAGGSARLKTPLLFFLSPRSAFISGQVLTVSDRVKATPDTTFPILKNKVAIVTGAAQGIGAEIVKVLAQEGAKIIGIDHPSQKEKLEARMAGLGGTALLFDLGDPTSVSKIVDYLHQNKTNVDILINNAGITRDKTIAKMTPEAWELVVRVNLQTPLKLSDEILSAGRFATNGRLLFLSSVVGIAGNFGQTNYSASKSGLIGVVNSMQGELAEKGITVNAIAPGFIETPMTGKMPVMMRQFGRRLSSLKQGGLPEDVAQCALFLVSPGAYGVTGETLRVCGQSLIG